MTWKRVYCFSTAMSKIQICPFTTSQLYKPRKFEETKRQLYLSKKLFKIFNKKRTENEDISKEPFYNTIMNYQQNKKRIYKNNKYNVTNISYEDGQNTQNRQVEQNGQDQKNKINKKETNLENLFFRSTNFTYLELQYILTTFLNHEKENIKKEDIYILETFFNFSEKEIFHYLNGDELLPQQYIQNPIIKKLLTFINIKHPSLN